MTLKERAAERKAKKRALELQFPGASLTADDGKGSRSVLILLEAGVSGTLSINKHGKWQGDDEKDEYWACEEIWIDDINKLGRFIHALTCRYNALVTEANGLAEQSAMKPLTRIKTPPQKQANGGASEWMG